MKVNLYLVSYSWGVNKVQTYLNRSRYPCHVSNAQVGSKVLATVLDAWEQKHWSITWNRKRTIIEHFKTLFLKMFSKGFFFILPTLLVFTEGKVTESFITASALKVSVLVSVKHAYRYKMVYLHAITVNVRCVTNGGFCLYKTENYCKLCNVWRDISALICHSRVKLQNCSGKFRASQCEVALEKKRRYRKKGKKNKSVPLSLLKSKLRAPPFVPG